MAATSKELLHRVLAALATGADAAALRAIVDEQHVFHGPDGDLYGIDGLRIAGAEYRRGLIGFDVRIKDILAEHDLVAARVVLAGTFAGHLFGIAPSGRSVELPGLVFGRVAAGRIVETWFAPSLTALRLASDPNEVP